MKKKRITSPLRRTPSEPDDIRFCDARKYCSLAEHILGDEDNTLPAPETLGNRELGEFIKRARSFKVWLDSAEKSALQRLLNGAEIDGLKVVEGRTIRRLSDVDGAFDILKACGFKESELYEKNPLGITALEKLVGKKQLEALIGEMIEKPRGKPTLAFSDDPRPRYGE